MAQYLPEGPLSAYLGVRASNEESDRREMGTLAQLLNRQEAIKQRQQALEVATQDRAANRELARETRNLQMEQAKAFKEQQLAMQRQSAADNLQVRQGQLEMQNQLATARIAQIGDEATRRREQDAWQRQYQENQQNLQREMFEFKQTQAQLGAGLSGEAAGKVAMADQAIMDIRDLRELIYNPDGSLKKDVIAAMNAPFTAGLPGSDSARKAFSKIKNAISAKYRIETGAAGSVVEMEDLARRFMPGIGDLLTPGVVKDRIDRLEQFMDTSIDQTKGVKIDQLRSRQGKSAAPAGGSKEGQKATSRSGKPMTFRNGQWEYD